MYACMYTYACVYVYMYVCIYEYIGIDNHCLMPLYLSYYLFITWFARSTHQKARRQAADRIAEFRQASSLLRLSSLRLSKLTNPDNKNGTQSMEDWMAITPVPAQALDHNTAQSTETLKTHIRYRQTLCYCTLLSQWHTHMTLSWICWH